MKPGEFGGPLMILPSASADVPVEITRNNQMTDDR